MVDFSNRKVPVFANINDIAKVPTAQQPGNGSDLIARHNSLIDDIESVLSLSIEVASVDKDYYVSPAGSDANNGLSAASPFATIQKAVDVASKQYIPHGVYININVMPGTYTARTTLKAFSGGGAINITGNTDNPETHLISTQNRNCFQGNFQQGKYEITKLKLQTGTNSSTNSGNGINIDQNGYIILSNCIFGNCGYNHIYLGGNITAIAYDCKVSAGATSFANISGRVYLEISGDVIISNAPNFSEAFLIANTQASAWFSGDFQGATTGKRYSIASLALVRTSSLSATFFPGDVNGTVDSGGVYLKADGTTL